ncbi:MAG: DNA polymerase Y family protein [Actinomycetota bacterium]|nr:DNA polymerase Y family protein [Actinomycetota bacterium]
MGAGAERTLVVWCPDWPVVAAGVAAPDGHPPDAPVAVLAANRVVACSVSARAEGVVRGLRRRQAEARCPGLVVVEHDPGRDARAFEPVAAVVEAFAPRVEILRPGMCALATRGPSRYFGGDEALAARVVQAVDAALPLGAPPCRVGVADGRFAAERAARAASAAVRATTTVPSPENRVGEGWLLVPPSASRAFLASFPVDTLEAGELVELLRRMGIRTLGDFAALPAKAVVARFGPEGAVAHRLARGLDERPLAARTPPPDLVVSAELDPPAERVETVAFVARSLASRLHDDLAARGLAMGVVRVEAETEHGEFLSRHWRLDRAVAAAPGALAERVRWQLDGWLSAPTRPSGPLTVLRLVPEEVRSDRGRQEGFWGGDREAAERVARAVERVQGRLGPEAVVTAVVGGGRGPAEQVRLSPWGDPPPYELAARAGCPWPGRLPAPAPATVPVQAVPAEVLDAAGVAVSVTGRGAVSAPPARVSIAGRPPVEVVAWAGPWPVDERWWDAAAHRRWARWQVVTADGGAHLLRLEGGCWAVEATYD